MPSVTQVEAMGDITQDLAINVYFEDADLCFWFAPELLEFISHDEGGEVTLDGVDKKWRRNGDCGWDELSTN
ncbi:MAG: hypothetical protein ACO1RA_20740 [Planctomycetaceae bacterium]